MTSIHASSLAVGYGKRPVVDNISLDLQPGELLVLIGTNGSGKSTLLKTLAGLIDPMDGAVTLLGSAPGRLPTQVAYLPQHPVSSHTLPLCVQDVVAMGRFAHLGLFKRSTNADRAIVLESMKRTGIDSQANDPIRDLSGGQQQRVAIVRALAMNPEVLLLDEITSALDPELVGEVLDVVRELKGSGITMLIATHEMNFAQEISDRVCFLDGGRVAEQGHPKQMFASPSDERTRQFLRRVNF